MDQHTLAFMKIFSGVQILTTEEGNALIRERLQSDETQPFIAGRSGATETRAILHDAASKPIPGEMLCNQSGVNLPSQKEYREFVKTYIQAIQGLDLIGLWRPEEKYFIRANYIQGEKTFLKGLEPYYFDKPWSSSLKGKKVLIIHPFVESIKKQFKKRTLIWPDKDVLPDFAPIYLKSFQTLGDKSSNWFFNLERMKESMETIDYDVALIGCGAYGLPLAYWSKLLGKNAIHLGGALQILFGIKGRRWDNDTTISKFYNENWVRPMDLERPDNYKMMEGGCYW